MSRDNAQRAAVTISLDALARETNPIRFGKGLDSYRRALGWSYRTMAEKAGLDSHMPVAGACNGQDTLATSRAKMLRAVEDAMLRGQARA